MAAWDARDDMEARHREIQRAEEGVERIPFLPAAVYVAVVPGVSDEPPYVFIEWVPGLTERPWPGTALWRAALAHYLASDLHDEQNDLVVRPLVRLALERFTSLDAWIDWTDHRRQRIEAERRRRRKRRLTIPGSWWPW